MTLARTLPDSIDWSQLWYASIRQAASVLTDAADWRAALNAHCDSLSLRNHRGLPLRFVEQALLPEGMAYESFISDTGLVPTRNNLHDLFNALVWLSFPNIKRQLNALQAAQIASHGISQSRGPTRDAATIFDENAALLVVSDTTQGRSLADAMRQHQWHNAFIEQRHRFDNDAAVWLFGHALMEKLVKPYKAITAHMWVVIAPSDFFQRTHESQRAWLDARVAEQLQLPDELSTQRFSPLPVLGVPGWWPNQDREFYDDVSVFRPIKSLVDRTTR